MDTNNKNQYKKDQLDKFKNSLRMILASKGINSAELARALNINKSIVSQWMNGRNFPSNDRIELLAQYLGVSINQLYGVEEDNSQTFLRVLPESINTITEAKSFLKTLNLYSFKEMNLESKSDKDILELARTLHVILTMSSKL